MDILWNGAAAVTASLVIAVLITAALLRERWRGPSLNFSGLYGIEARRGIRVRLVALPRVGAYCALVFFLAAFIDLHTFAKKAPDSEIDTPPPFEGIAIYLVLDKSGSMHEKVRVKDRFGTLQSRSKMDILKDVTVKFVEGDKSLNLEGRPNDLIGVVAFSRGAEVIAPLTLDHSEVARKLKKLTYSRDPQEVGTSIGYAIFKSVSLIEATRLFGQEQVNKAIPAYEIKNSVVVLVTDGIQEINADDRENPRRSLDMLAAADYARSKGVRLYIVNIEPRIAGDEFTPYRQIFEEMAKETGGRFFMAVDPSQLEEVYKEIDSLEKSQLPIAAVGDKELLPHLYNRFSFNSHFIIAGLLFLFLSILLQTTWLRRAL